jgi:SAM-dependent methyltransferase
VEVPSALVFDGERAIPDHVPSRHLFCRHLFAYEWVFRQLGGARRVLDVGSGEGYGPSLIGGGGTEVVGVDVSVESVRHARKSYGQRRVSFLAMDAHRLGFRTATFDAVISLQTVEHLEDVKEYLGEVARVLKPGGLFAVSTLNKRLYSPHGGRCCVEYHVREFEAQEFRALLSEWFGDVEMWGVQASQRVRDLEFFIGCPTRHRSRIRSTMAGRDYVGLGRILPAQLKRCLVEAVAGVSRSRMLAKRPMITTGDFWVSDQDLDSALDLLALCRSGRPLDGERIERRR